MRTLSRLNRDNANYVVQNIFMVVLAALILAALAWMLISHATAYLEDDEALYALHQRGYSEVILGGTNRRQCYTGRYARLSREFRGRSIEGYRTTGVLCASYGKTTFEVIITAQRR